MGAARYPIIMTIEKSAAESQIGSVDPNEALGPEASHPKQARVGPPAHRIGSEPRVELFLQPGLNYLQPLLPGDFGIVPIMVGIVDQHRWNRHPL